MNFNNVERNIERADMQLRVMNKICDIFETEGLDLEERKALLAFIYRAINNKTQPKEQLLE